jgi:hypothetical protein
MVADQDFLIESLLKDFESHGRAFYSGLSNLEVTGSTSHKQNVVGSPSRAGFDLQFFNQDHVALTDTVLLAAGTDDSIGKLKAFRSGSLSSRVVVFFLSLFFFIINLIFKQLR